MGKDGGCKKHRRPSPKGNKRRRGGPKNGGVQRTAEFDAALPGKTPHTILREIYHELKWRGK